MNGFTIFGQMTVAMIRLYSRVSPLRTVQAAALLTRFGPDKPMPTMLRDLKPCDIGKAGPARGSGSWS